MNVEIAHEKGHKRNFIFDKGTREGLQHLVSGTVYLLQQFSHSYGGLQTKATFLCYEEVQIRHRCNPFHQVILQSKKLAQNHQTYIFYYNTQLTTLTRNTSVCKKGPLHLLFSDTKCFCLKNAPFSHTSQSTSSPSPLPPKPSPHPAQVKTTLMNNDIGL